MSNLEVTTVNNGRVVVAEAAVARLRTRLHGDVILPGDAGYDTTRRVWNGMVDKRPALIVRCADTADVIGAVTFARDHDLLVSVHAGGHNIAGKAVAEGGLMIDLARMRSVQVDPAKRTARVDGGATLGDLDRATQVFGLATTAGVVTHTGVAFDRQDDAVISETRHILPNFTFNRTAGAHSHGGWSTCALGRQEHLISGGRARRAGRKGGLAMNDGEILGLNDMRFAAMIARDFAALEKLAHDELLYTHSSGVTDTKASWLESMKSGNVKYRSASCSERQVKVFGDTVLVRGKAAIEAEIGGQPRSLKLLFLNAWVRTPQGWKFAAWQSCPQPQ